MRRWPVALALALACLGAAALLLVRHAGHLGGPRQAGGPLGGGGIGVGTETEVGRPVTFGVMLDTSRQVTLERITLHGSGLAGLRPRFAAYAPRRGVGSAVGPLPRGGRPVDGTTLRPGASAPELLVAVSPTRPGTYRFTFDVDHRDGHRRFRRRATGADVELVVTRRP